MFNAGMFVAEVSDSVEPEQKGMSCVNVHLVAPDGLKDEGRLVLCGLDDSASGRVDAWRELAVLINTAQPTVCMLRDLMESVSSEAGLLVRLDQGMIFASDSRTNAGMDNVARFCKMTVFERRGDRVIVLLSSGNLAGTMRAKICSWSSKKRATSGRSINRRRSAKPCTSMNPSELNATSTATSARKRRRKRRNRWRALKVSSTSTRPRNRKL